MTSSHEQPSRDPGEYVDPVIAADELIMYASWLKNHAEREAGRRIPQRAAMLLDAVDDKRRGIDVVYSTFVRFRPRRRWVNETKRKMLQELLLNEEEKRTFDEQSRG